jgi:predicted dehydrogenase
MVESRGSGEEVAVDRLRIGTLGAARITPSALIKPARQLPGVTVAAVAARDPERARRFADKYRIRVVHPSYEALIADPAIDAIYNPLPNSLHALWTLRAIEAGKHVLCEKPFTANAAEAAEVAAAAGASGLVVMEAFGYRYHPLARRMVEVVLGQAPSPGGKAGQAAAGGRVGQAAAGGVAGQAAGGGGAGQATAGIGEIGPLRYLEASLCFPLPRFSDIRYSYELAGGATMHAGCYAINWLRMLGPGEPEVVAAGAKLHSPNVDRAMSASFRFPGGVLGRMTTSMWSAQLLRMDAKAVGDRGVMRVLNYTAPQRYNRLTVTADGYTRRERVSGEPVITTPEDAVANMTVIDAVYQAAGLPPRGRG